MKKVFKHLLILLALLTLLLCSCSRQTQTANVPVSDISAKLLSDLAWVDNMRQLEDSVIEKFYNFDTSKIDSLEVYISDSGSTAEEIAIVKLSDSSGKNGVYEAMEKRIEKQKKQFENYMPEEMYKLENALITEQGDYILLVIADEFEKADELFVDCFNA